MPGRKVMDTIEIMKKEKVRLLKSVRLGKRSQMVLPKEVRDWLGVKEGERVVFQIGDDGVKLIGPEDFAKSTLGIFKGMWGKTPAEVDAYLKGERASWRKSP